MFKFESRRELYSVIQVRANARLPKLGRQNLCGSKHGIELFASTDRNDNHLIRGEHWRENETLIVTVSHDDCANHPSRHSPGCAVALLSAAAVHSDVDV